jgi:hypothetical protein
MLRLKTMITIVISGYAVLMLTIVFALLRAARRPEPKRNAPVMTAELPVRPKKVVRPTPLTPAKTLGGTEVLAFGA